MNKLDESKTMSFPLFRDYVMVKPCCKLKLWKMGKLYHMDYTIVDWLLFWRVVHGIWTT